MSQFLTDLPSFAFLQYAVIAAVLASISSGVVGSIIVVRRSTYIAGAISHCILGGMGAARYLQVVYGWQWLTPLAGAVAAALFAGLLVGLTTLYGKERTDSVLSALWAVGMAVGITFIVKTPGAGQDLMSYLFGNILMVTAQDLVIMTVLNGIILVLVLLFYNRILAICFNEEAALVRGIPVGFYTVVMLVVISLTTVLLVEVVGVVLVIALLAIPAATVAPFTNRLSSMMIAASLLCLVLTLGGLVLSYGPDLPVGATIIELAGGVYLLSMVWRKINHRR